MQKKSQIISISAAQVRGGTSQVRGGTSVEAIRRKFNRSGYKEKGKGNGKGYKKDINREKIEALLIEYRNLHFQTYCKEKIENTEKKMVKEDIILLRKKIVEDFDTLKKLVKNNTSMRMWHTFTSKEALVCTKAFILEFDDYFSIK